MLIDKILNETIVNEVFYKCSKIQEDDTKVIVPNFAGGIFEFSSIELKKYEKKIQHMFNEVKGYENWEDLSVTIHGDEWTKSEKCINKFIALCMARDLIKINKTIYF